MIFCVYLFIWDIDTSFQQSAANPVDWLSFVFSRHLSHAQNLLIEEDILNSTPQQLL